METILIEQPTNKRPYPMLHLAKRSTDGIIITGCYPGHVWEVGDKVLNGHSLIGGNFNSPIEMTVTEVIEQRDHKGVFEDPSKKINSYFKIKIKA